MNVYIPIEEGNLLYSLIRHVRPEITVEVGMANGLSTLFMAQALHDKRMGKHIAIDPFQHSEWKGAGLKLLQRAGLESLVELIQLPSHQALSDLERRGLVAGFIFIDGSHAFDYVLANFLCADRLLKISGLLAFDDSDWPAIRQVLRYIVKNRHYEVAFPNSTVEDPKHHPTFLARILRRIARRVRRFATKLRPEFMTPDFEIGIRGRCVVLRKLKPDDRDSQSRIHYDY